MVQASGFLSCLLIRITTSQGGFELQEKLSKQPGGGGAWGLSCKEELRPGRHGGSCEPEEVRESLEDSQFPPNRLSNDSAGNLG